MTDCPNSDLISWTNCGPSRTLTNPRDNNTLHTEPRAARLFLLARCSPRPGERCRYPAQKPTWKFLIRRPNNWALRSDKMAFPPQISKRFRLRTLLLTVTGCCLLLAAFLSPIQAYRLESNLLQELPSSVKVVSRANADSIMFC